MQLDTQVKYFLSKLSLSNLNKKNAFFVVLLGLKVVLLL